LEDLTRHARTHPPHHQSPPSTTPPKVRASAGKTLWYPGANAPAHLDANAPGYAGFDPLNLGANSPAVLSYFQESERVHGRWAMAAMAGILASPSDWWTAGAKPTPVPLGTLLAVEVAFMAFVEAKRYEGWQKRVDKFFDPAGMDSPEMRTKEIKNGRLAMLAVLGSASVHAVRGLTPLEALKSHISNPWAENIYTSSVGREFAVAVALGATIPMIIEARKVRRVGGGWGARWTVRARRVRQAILVCLHTHTHTPLTHTTHSLLALQMPDPGPEG
jgi:hypothetical protein